MHILVWDNSLKDPVNRYLVEEVELVDSEDKDKGKLLPFLLLFANMKSNSLSLASVILWALGKGKDYSVLPDQTCWKGRNVPSGVLATSNV